MLVIDTPADCKAFDNLLAHEKALKSKEKILGSVIEPELLEKVVWVAWESYGWCKKSLSST